MARIRDLAWHFRQLETLIELAADTKVSLPLLQLIVERISGTLEAVAEQAQEDDLAALADLQVTLQTLGQRSDALRQALHFRIVTEFDDLGSGRRDVAGVAAAGSAGPDAVAAFHSGHDSSPTGYGTEPESAPEASAEVAASADGDTLGDGTDTAPGTPTSVEQSSVPEAGGGADPMRAATRRGSRPGDER